MVWLKAVAHPEFLHDVARCPRANGAQSVLHSVGQLHLFAILQKARSIRHDLCVQRVRHRVAWLIAVINNLICPIDCDQHGVKIKIIKMRRTTANLCQQIGAANDVIKTARANLCQNLAHFLRVEGDKIDNLICIACEFRAQAFILRANAHGAGVRLALTHHDASHGNQCSRADTIFFGPHHGCHDNVTTCAQATIGAQGDAVAQVVHRQDLMRLCQAHLPWQTRIFNRGRGASTRATIMARDQDDIRLCLSDTRRNRANARRGHQFHGHFGAWVDLLEIIDQLRQILDGIDVVMRWRRDQRHAFGRMTQARNQICHLHARQLTTFTRLGTLCNLDFQLLAMVQIFRCNTKATRCDLFDLSAWVVTIWFWREMCGIFTTFTTIRFCTNAIHRHV